MMKIFVASFCGSLLLVHCLLETSLLENHHLRIRDYTVYRLDATDGLHAHGGVALIVKSIVPSRRISINTDLQVLAVRVFLPTMSFTVCNWYLPPGQNITEMDINAVISGLPPPYILVGDFNAHNSLWGSTRVCRRGEMIENIMQAHNLVLLNTGAPTHMCFATGSLSSIDLTLCSSTIASHLEWTVLSEVYGSDHFPVSVHLAMPLPSLNSVRHWMLSRANWTHYKQCFQLSDENFTTVDDMVRHFTDTVIQAAAAAIPMSSGRLRHSPVPWWNSDCAAAVHARKKALRIVNQHPTSANLIAYKKQRAETRRVLKESKQRSWRNYISTLSSSTPSSVVWHRVRRIQGISACSRIPPILVDDSPPPTLEAVAEELAAHFADVTSSRHYSPEFVAIKSLEEEKSLNFLSSGLEPYNLPFTMAELDSAIRSTPDTAPGPDLVHNAMLRELRLNAKLFLLCMYNRIWVEHNLPLIWLEAVIIPLPKAGKDLSKACNYRPISLTSCLCKVFERMINRRLMWTLETRNLLTNVQCGFRHHRSTFDHLVSLATAISNSFVLRQHLVAVFFDIEKAYDTTWRYGILKTLHSWGFRGHLPLLLQGFLRNRSFRVRVGDVLSSRHTFDNGVPQGSVLSVTLFAIAINSIVDSVRSPVQSSLFVDDFAIYCSSSSISVIERLLQLVLNCLHQCSCQTGFVFSLTKTCCMHFCRRYSLHLDPVLYLGESPLPFVESAKFLGLYFDRRLTWKRHINHIRTRCTSPINLLRILSGTRWGADRICLLRLYRALVRPILDYGSIVYNSAAVSTLRPVNTIHHTGIRLSTGAFRTSRIECLLVDASEPPLAKRRDFLLGSYAAKLTGLVQHPTKRTVLKPTCLTSFASRPSLPQPVNIRLYYLLQRLQFTFPSAVDFPRFVSSPWTLLQAKYDFSLLSLDKSSTSSFIYRTHFQEMISAYPECNIIYTDGSAGEDGVGCAFHSSALSRQYRLHSFSSTYTAELWAIYVALQHIHLTVQKRTVIYSDSLSALQAIHTLYNSDALVQKVQLLIHILLSQFSIVLCWVPGHVGIVGNEAADRAAKAATKKSAVDITSVPTRDTRCRFKNLIKQEWQSEWDKSNFKLSPIKTSVEPWSSSSRVVRREEVLLTQLRIGHCRLSHGFLLAGEVRPICGTCLVLLSVQHILIDFLIYGPSRA